MTERASWGFAAGDELVPGRFVEERLGGGRLAEVYLASDERLLDPVVVKMLRPGRTSGRDRRKLAREGAVLRDLDHPMILQLIDEDLASERPHLVLEFIEGPRLSSVIRRHGPLPLEQAVGLAVQLCAALDHLHRRGYVHLDVKPSNIVMGAPPRLIDLSVARTTDGARALRSTVGTDAYMAPEQCVPEDAGGVGPEADVWGLGATLWEALSGSRPFPRRDDERFPQVRNRPVPLPDRIPARVTDALARCLSVEPARRPGPAELAEQLGSVVAAVPRRALLGRLRPTLRRRGRPGGS